LLAGDRWGFRAAGWVEKTMKNQEKFNSANSRVVYALRAFHGFVSIFTIEKINENTKISF
jgi:hypothetical protein